MRLRLELGRPTEIRDRAVMGVRALVRMLLGVVMGCILPNLHL